MAKVADSHTLDLKTVADKHVRHSCSQRVYLSVDTSSRHIIKKDGLTFMLKLASWP